MASNPTSSFLQKADVILDGRNYKAWTATISVILRGLDLWGHIDGTEPAPPPPIALPANSSSSTVSTGPSSQRSEWAKWRSDDSRAIAVICQSVELPIRLQVFELPMAKAIWDHLRRLYLPSSQALRYSLFQTLGTCYQRDRSVQEFFAELTDLWRQGDEMAPTHCLTCSQCECAAVSARDRDF